MNKLLCTSITNRLKEKGFTFDLPITYDGNGIYYHSIEPRISQVLDWLREEKNLHIVIDITNYGFISSTISFKWDKSYCENEIEHYDHKGYSTYEDVAVEEIEYVLDNLI